MKRTIKAIIVILITIELLMTSTKVNAQTLTINTETLMLRKETSTDSSILELLSYGEKYEIVGEEGNWYKIKTAENTGYVHKDYVIAETGATGNTTNEGNTIANEIEGNTVENEITNHTVPDPVTEPEPTEPEKPQEVDTTMRVSQETKLRVLPLVQAIVLEKLKADTEVEVVTRCNKWAYVSTQTQTGWVRVDMLAKVDNAQDISNYEEKQEDTQEPTTQPTESENPVEMNKKGYISGTGVNVRSMASTQGEVVEVLNTNAEVTVIEQEGDWYKIRYGSIEGYVIARYVSDNEVEVTSRGGRVQREQSTEASEKVVAMPVASTKGDEIVAYAKQYLGKPYVYGGSGPNSFDCSGFTMYVFNHFGISMSHSANAQSRLGTAVNKAELQAGDLVFFEDYETKSGIGHVGIYIGNGDFIHASSGSGYCVKISTLLSGSYNSRYLSAKRLV